MAARAEPNRGRIGDMLVAAGLVTADKLASALDAQRTTGLPIGKQIVALGHATETQVTRLLSQQLSVPWVSLERIDFSEQLLARVPGELADRFTVMPIYVRNVRHQGATLYVAMDDPTHEEALRRVSLASGLPVKPMIASPSDIRRAIDEHYFAAPGQQTTPRGSLDELPSVARAVSFVAGAGTEKLVASEPKGPRGKPPPPPGRPARTDGSIPVEQYETPSSPPNGQSARTLTLLDGTTISLPSGAKRPAQSVTEVRHVIRAVRSANADLGIEAAPRWHDVLQVVLEAVSSRGVKLTRKDVAEAWARQHGAARGGGAKSDG